MVLHKKNDSSDASSGFGDLSERIFAIEHRAVGAREQRTRRCAPAESIAPMLKKWISGDTYADMRQLRVLARQTA